MNALTDSEKKIVVNFAVERVAAWDGVSLLKLNPYRDGGVMERVVWTIGYSRAEFPAFADKTDEQRHLLFLVWMTGRTMRCITTLVGD